MKMHNDWLLVHRQGLCADDLKTIDYNKSFSVKLNDDFYECVYTGKAKHFYQVKVLRHVTVPYMKDGKARGWFKGSNGEPLRWTGLGNALYLKGECAEKSLYALLDALTDGVIDDRFMKQEDGFIGFAPTKLSLLQPSS